MIKLVECPRDAMQGIQQFIPTELKARYINLLLKAGFDTIDFGSFVSEKAIPQLADTRQVLSQLEMGQTSSKLLAIAANLRGVRSACEYEQITYIGFPFSISETFQKRNANSSIADSLDTVEQMLEQCQINNKKAVIYLSMGFGNPYGDEWSESILEQRAGELVTLGARILSLADTTGQSTSTQIRELFPKLQSAFSEVEWGLHLHSTPAETTDKLKAAFDCGCTRIDSAVKGYGGCPMASDSLTGNIATEEVLEVLKQRGLSSNVDPDAFAEALQFADEIFLHYH